MTHIKITIPEGDEKAAVAFGRALLDYAGHDVASVQRPGREDTPEPTAFTSHDDAAPGETVNEKYKEPYVKPAEDDSDEGEDDVQVDHHGVAKDPRYCSSAADPFYSSGKRSGQWKRRKGVSDDDYDAWYAEQLRQLQDGSDEEDAEPAPTDTSAAFGADAPPPPPPEEDAEQAPTSCGEFMTWISEHQVAQRLTADDISEAYQQHGIGVTDLFPPNDEATIRERIAKLYGTLSAKVA